MCIVDHDGRVELTVPSASYKKDSSMAITSHYTTTEDKHGLGSFESTGPLATSFHQDFITPVTSSTARPPTAPSESKIEIPHRNPWIFRTGLAIHHPIKFPTFWRRKKTMPNDLESAPAALETTRPAIRKPAATCLNPLGEKGCQTQWDDHTSNPLVQTRIWVPDDIDDSRADSPSLPMPRPGGVHVRTYISSSTEASALNYN